MHPVQLSIFASLAFRLVFPKQSAKIQHFRDFSGIYVQLDHNIFRAVLLLI